MKTTIIQLPKILDARGNLSFIEENNQIPFKIERTYWIYDVPGGAARGGHAFKKQNELIVALSGGFDVVLDDGKVKSTFHLNRSYYGLYISNMVWWQLENFSSNSIALILASTTFDEDDYIRDYDHYLQLKNQNDRVG